MNEKLLYLDGYNEAFDDIPYWEEEEAEAQHLIDIESQKEMEQELFDIMDNGGM